MKNILLSALFFVCSIPHNALASGLSEADSLFDKGRFDKAVQAYEVAAKGSVGDDKLRAVYRAVQSKALSFAYAEAAQRLLEEPLPNDRLWQARFLLLRAELFRQYLRQYGRAMPADRQDSASDVTRWSAAQWHERIQAAYQLLWPLRGELSRVSLASESYFMKKGEPEEDIPTLLDFLVYSWSDYLLTQAPAGDALPDAAPFVVSQYPGRLDFSMPPAHVAALLMTEASGAHVHKERRKAAELWRIRRLLLPFEHQDRFKLPEDMKSLRLKAGTVLARWTEVFTLPETRAEAAYHAADFLEQDGDYAASVQLCKRAASLWHGTPGAAKCERLKARIEMPSLSITAHNTPPGGGNAFSINVRNMDSVYCRLYKTTPQELLRLSRRGAERDYYYLLGLDSKAVQDGFLARKADREWKVSPAYPAQYVAIRQDVDAAGLERGLYVAIVSDDDSFRPGSSFISAGIVNCTDLFLLGSAGFRARPSEFFFAPELGGRGVSADGFHLYAVDALSGAPVQGANISAFYDQDFSRRQKLTAATDKYGMASLRSLFTLAYPASSNYRLAPLAERGKSLAYWGQEGGFSYSVPAPLELYLETDRPVYRPGQEVSFKATVLRRTADGFAVQSTPLQVRVSAHDANYQEFGVLTLKTNGMGSVSGSFKIPQGRLLGGYTLRAVADAYGAEFESSQGFAVEEYKRPEFELKLGEAKDAWRYGRKAVVRGKASYYFGGPVPQAKVSYQIYRRRYMPWYAWWAFWFRPDSPKAEVASGSVQTDQDGNFFIEFKPAPEPGAFEKEPSSFIVEAQAHDAGGRTITDSKTYQAGARAYMFKVDLPAGFARPWASYDIAVRLMNLNDTQVLGRGSYALYKLEPVLKDDGVYASGGGFGWSGQPQAAQRLEEAFLDVTDGAKVQSGDFLFSDVGAEHVRLKNLPEGIYRLQLKADDIWGGVSEQSLIVLSAGNEPKLPIPSVAMLEQKTCQVGETARVLAGSSELKGALYAEIWAGNFLLGRQVFAKGGLRVLEIPVEREHVGGFAVRWFGASDFKIYSGQELVDVPRPEKDLSVSLDAPKTQEPGSQASWLLTVKDRQGRPVQGEALVKVYDRSLEYYASADASWLDALYQANGGPGMLNMPFFDTPGMSFPVKKGLLASLWQTVRGGEARSVPPSLRLGGGDNYYAEGMAYGGGAMMRKSLSAPGGAVMAEAMDSNAAMPQSSARADRALDGMAGSGGGGAPTASTPVVRSDFSETAYFKPQLAIKKGFGRINFRMPERLTSWQVAVTALTADVKRGKASAQVQTRKDFMARLEMPRFFREGDSGVIKAVLHNETDTELKAQVTLQLEKEGRPAGGLFGLKDASLQADMKPGEVKAVEWEIAAPRGVALYNARIVARAASYSDAEERDLPVLASRQRLIASQIKSLDGNSSAALSLDELKSRDDSRAIESLHLEVDPQLALPVLNSLPFLVNYPYECTEQLVNRYVPLAIVNRLYAQYPGLSEAVRKIPARNTITPAWERDNPARMMALLETPWEELSRGQKSGLPLTDMLKPALVARERSAALEKLASYQMENGAFPWFPGGREDLYMTLYALEGFAQARGYGVPVPEDIVRKAMAYVNGELPRRLGGDEGPVSLMLYASYVMTAFPKDWEESQAGFENARQWLDYAARHIDVMTAYGKAHAALAWARLGDRKKSDDYLARALDGAKTAPISGVYWAPEKIAWLWYNDSVEKHAFLLRALVQLRPQDPKIAGMVQWLLFNRKGNEWKSTRASAGAIYSLLEVMKARGALDKGDSYSMNWGSEKIAADVGAQDWLEKPLRWSRYGADASAAYVQAKVAKNGPGLAFATLTGIYSTEQLAQDSPAGMLNVRREYFLRVKKGADYALQPLKSGDTVSVGDQVEVHLTVNCRSQFEYVQLKDPRGAGFEAETLNSGWQWDNLSRYEEPRDSLSNFFMPWLPHGEYVLNYRIRPTTPGTYRIGAAVIQSMYAPEFGAHSGGMMLNVK